MLDISAIREPKEFQHLVFDKASAPDLQQAQPTRKQAMCKHMVDGRGYKGGDARERTQKPNFEVPRVYV